VAGDEGQLARRPPEGEVLPPEGDEPPAMELVEFFASRSGPLPSADEYAAYERAYPGSAERILQLAERSMEITEHEVEHRHSVEAKVVEGNLENQRRGQAIAAVLAFTGLIAAVVLIALGQSVEGLIALLVPLGVLASRFLKRNGP
jgi:uncharacterized membrane protein